MEKDILSKVIGVEKEIQDVLDIEKRKSEEWLEGVKKEVEEEFLREEGTLKESLKKAEEDRVADARRKAAEILEDAKEHTERLAKISDETLKKIIIKHIIKILP